MKAREGRCDGDILRTLTEEGKPGNESSFVSLSGNFVGMELQYSPTSP